jgi:hypothetical protein
MAASVTPKDVWDGLLSAGASAVQAAGIMGNWISESGLDPESVNPGGPQDGVGIAQWQTTDYPDVPMPTGNPARDLVSQITFFTQTGGLQAAQGTTPQEVAASVAENYERCASCAAGGQQNAARQSQAGQVAGWAADGSWPSSLGGATTTATLTSAQAANVAQGQAECLWAIGENGIPGTSVYVRILSLGTSSGNVGAGSFCIFSKTQARAMIGTALLTAGGLIMTAGLVAVALAAGLPMIAGAARMIPGAGAVAAAAGTAAGGTAADASGTSPEFRAAFLS